jgi:hypothetical protein
MNREDLGWLFSAELLFELFDLLAQAQAGDVQALGGAPECASSRRP